MTPTENVVERFDAALRAAAMARVPIPWTFRELSPRTPASSNQFTTDALAQRISRVDISRPAQYRAALMTFAHTEAFDLVLDALTVQSFARQDLAKSVRRWLWYLVIVLFVASLLALFFSEMIAPTIRWLQSDLALVPSSGIRPSPSTEWLTLLVRSLIGSWIVVFLVVLFGGSSLVARCLGGSKYLVKRATATLLRTMSGLIQRGVSTDEAYSLACDLVNASLVIRDQVPMAVRIQSFHGESISELRTLADEHLAEAERRLTTLRVTLPMFIVPLIGGTAVLAYSLGVFWPIVNLLKDLSLPGVRI